MDLSPHQLKSPPEITALEPFDLTNMSDVRQNRVKERTP